jgi:amino-acid N-acetyltransferase
LTRLEQFDRFRYMSETDGSGAEGGSIAIRRAFPGDFASAAILVEQSGLPREGLREHFSRALVADSGGTVVGCVALEVYGRVALLRSLAVAPNRRGERLGERLAGEALRLARESGARDVYLLTQTASGFFPRFGFAVEERSRAPEALGQSVEFQSACPSSAVLMHVRVPDA